MDKLMRNALDGAFKPDVSIRQSPTGAWWGLRDRDNAFLRRRGIYPPIMPDHFEVVHDQLLGMGLTVETFPNEDPA